VRDFNPAYDRYGSKADFTRHLGQVRFTPESGHARLASKCPLSAKSGHLHCNKFLPDHFVGEPPELPRHIEAERLGSL
jgi:hypothetical protein